MEGVGQGVIQELRDILPVSNKPWKKDQIWEWLLVVLACGKEMHRKEMEVNKSDVVLILLV